MTENNSERMQGRIGTPWAIWLGLSLLAVASAGLAANPDQPAEFTITTRVVLTNPLPIGVNEFGDSGGTHWSAGNLIPDSGFEPINIRRYWRVTNAGTNWAELDGGGMTDWDLVTSGYLSGAEFRLYRIVDTNGNPLPQRSGYLDLSLADRFVKVRSGRVIPKGAPGFPDGGWVCTRYTQPAKVFGTRSSLSFTDAQWVENGRTYYYIVTAVSDGSAYPPGNIIESDPATAVEVSATPEASLGGGPRIYVPEGDALAEIPAVRSGSWFSWTPRVANATGTVRWSLLDTNDQPMSPPAGLSFNTNSGALSGTPTTTPGPTWLRLRVTAENGSDSRDFLLNPPPWTPSGNTNRPAPPQNVVAVAGNKFVRLTWDPSPSTNVVGYRIFRSTAPRTQQVNRVYFEGDGPAPLKDDYLLFDLRVLAVDSSWSHPRVRDINSKVSETWSASSADVSIRRELHGTNLPPEFRFPGESCLRITATNPGSRYITGPAIFFPDVKGGEANWYGQLEAGKTYRYEVWLRQEGLANTGRVELTFHQMYTGIKQAFLVTTQWQRFGFDFVAPPPPTNGWHGMPRLNFTGPGTLWMDNIRLFRFDTPAEREADFVPGKRVFDELMEAQPATGPKGMLRSMGVMLNSASMKSLLSYHRDAGATLDWYQAANAAPNMTLPFFLEYALRTGDQPANRMRPWLNIASFTTEDEWLALIEYLAAPINPADPAERAAKPWAWLRYQQRGVATPWADEFERIYLEFANETWHNRASPGTLYWWGWGQFSAVHQGGKEFGLWARYITDLVATHSPYWEARQLADKLIFVMGSNYQDYAEKGRPFAPRVKAIGHAPYVGPKWETGDPPNAVFDDHGLQGTLLGWIAGTALDMDKYRVNRERLAAQGHFYELVGYESGPSGYSLPGSASAEQVEISEQYGKSLAMAVAALDAWLGSHEAGMTERGQLAFAQGQYWSSHTLMNDGYRPHAHWQAIKLRNRFASGQMVRVRTDATPTIAWNNKDWPLIGCYAFRDGAKLSVFVLSRKLGGVHDGHDFGDGSTPVTLHLPANPVGPAMLYSLTGDPRTNNRTALVLTIQTQQVAMTRSHTFTMPQGSIYLFVVNTDLPQVGAVPPTPEGFQVAFTSSGAVLSWNAAPGATGYRVYRGTNDTFSLSAGAAEFAVAGTSWTDPDAWPGTVFYYRVAATNEFGEGMPSLVAVGGTNNSPPPPPAVLIPAGSYWRYHDRGVDLGTAWRAPDYDDSSWSLGLARLGYGGDGEQTTLSFGPDPNNKYPTAYFRRPFAVADPGVFRSLQVRLTRDDGAVVYLNGVEVFRSNMPTGQVTYATTAASTVTGADETNWFSYSISPALLVPGINLLAAEVHQSNPTSGDLGFDLELLGYAATAAPPQPPVILQQPRSQTVIVGDTATLTVLAAGDPPLAYQWQRNGLALSGQTNALLVLTNVQFTQAGAYAVVVSNPGGVVTSAVALLVVTNPPPIPVTNTLIPTSALWRYHDKGVDLGTAWRAPDYDDSTWSNGIAKLGYGGDGEATTLSFGANSALKHPTYYFRHAFTVTRAADYTNLTARLIRDDGAVIYLNGVEVWRDNMPAGSISYTTLAAATVGGSDENRWFTNALNPALLVEGMNVLAAEVHQATRDSSDLGFNFELVGIRFSRPVVVPPVLNARYESTPPACLLSFSSEPGQSYTLLASTNLADWEPVTQWTGTGALLDYRLPLPGSAGVCFYRLRIP